MADGANSALADDWAAALGWWREAGVDLDFADTPEHWLAVAEATEPERPVAPTSAPSPPPPPRPMIGGDPALWPNDLDGFRAWWLAEPSLDGGATDRRVPPSGGAGAAMLVVTEQPEAEDSDSLLSGPGGELVAGFARAAGIAPEALAIISALPRHRPLPDWSGLRETGLGAVLAHHIALIAPQAIVVLGRNVLSLLGHDPAQSAASLLHSNHEGATIPLLAARGLETLARPGAKAALWRGWLDLTGTKAK